MPRRCSTRRFSPDRWPTIPVADSFDRSRERDLSTGDIPNVFVASAVWDLPWGSGRQRQGHGVVGALANDWTLAVVVTRQSGIPVAVTQTTNFNAFAGFGTQRPNLVGDPELPADERTPARWFNTAAFATAPVFTLGSASRNPVRGPGYKNVDLAISRRIPLPMRGGTALELRAEAFNLFNAPPFANPGATLGTPTFGDHLRGWRSARRPAGGEVPVLTAQLAAQQTCTLGMRTRSLVVGVLFLAALAIAAPAAAQRFPVRALLRRRVVAGHRRLDDSRKDQRQSR